MLELLIGISVGGILILGVSTLMTGNIRSAGKIEITERARKTWNRTTNFIDSEVAQSERVIYDSSLIDLAQCSPEISSDDFVFALDIAPNLYPSIFYVQDNTSNSKQAREDQSLWRCGHSFDVNGEYVESETSPLEPHRLVDGLSKEKSCILTVDSSNNTEAKKLTYNLCIVGNEDEKYSQSVSASSRVNPTYIFPSENTLCNPNLTVEGFNYLGGTSAGQALTAETNSTSIICGYGGDDTLTGSSGNDIIEAGDNSVAGGGGSSGEESDNSDSDECENSCINSGPPYCVGNSKNWDACCFIDPCSSSGGSGGSGDSGGTGGSGGSGGSSGGLCNGQAGNDRLMGGPGDDTLEGGAGNDVLIGREGDDSLVGGAGDDQYVPGEGVNTITDVSGLDVVYIDKNQEDVSGLDNCTQSSCTLTYSVNGSSSSASLTGIDVIVFRDKRVNAEKN